MQINTLKLKAKKKKRKLVGRGGKKGTYSGRGCKGQKSRSGSSINPLFEGGRSSLVERMKKVRGFKSIEMKGSVIQVSDLEKSFNDNDVISIESLLKTNLLNKSKNIKKIKILGSADLKKKFTISSRIFLSDSAKKSIEKAGGKVESGEKK